MRKKSIDNIQPSFSAVELAANPEPRCSCGLLIDRSGSMAGISIAEVNSALLAFQQSLLADHLASLRVEIGLISFGDDVTVDVNFTSPQNFHPPTLVADGGTSLGAAVIKGLELIESRIAEYRVHGVSYYRPWLVLMTDGEATDDVDEATKQLKKAESKKRVSFFPVGVQSANMAKLAQLSLRPPLKLNGLDFRGFFEWMSVGLSSVSRSKAGEQVSLPKPTWAQID